MFGEVEAPLIEAILGHDYTGPWSGFAIRVHSPKTLYRLEGITFFFIVFIALGGIAFSLLLSISP